MGDLSCKKRFLITLGVERQALSDEAITRLTNTAEIVDKNQGYYSRFQVTQA